MDPSTYLYDMPPAVVEGFCNILDAGEDRFGWRELAVRIPSRWLDVRMLERKEATGRSPTKELLWSWAQQNSKVQDLLEKLQNMGHSRALQFLQSQSKESPLPARSHHAGSSGQTSTAKEKETLQLPASASSQPLSPEKHPREKQPPILTFQDVIEGTRDFHHEMRISEGHFSDLYRAQMGQKTFAVKLFKQKNMASWKKDWDIFRDQMESLYSYQHPNIIELLGCFSDEGRYCLVYPYLPNRSLFHRLHHQGQEPPLSWEERLSIIKGTAKALYHLHTALPCEISCSNISSANILLDDDLQPKLSDVGLAHLRSQTTNQHCTITLKTSNHRNFGYLPEEYIRDGKPTLSVDVYGFGVVIMETVTGRNVTKDVPKQRQLVDLLRNEVENSGGLESCQRFLDKTAGTWPPDLARKLLSLALDCAASRQRNRPSMEKVLRVLSLMLPTPVCPFADQPHCLDDRASLNDKHMSSPSLPVEHDEQHSLLGPPALTEPCECSQSEVTYLSDIAVADGETEVDLYCSWPVQCSCPTEPGDLACEDCRANGFSLNYTDSPQTDFSVVENCAMHRV